MKNFESKWQQLAGRARQATPRGEAAPFGFATRVLARARVDRQPLSEELWGRLTLRLLGVVGCVLLIGVLLEGPHLRSARCLEAGVENTVAQILWRL